MGRLGLAFQLFFKILFNQETANQVQTALLPAPMKTPKQEKPKQAPAEPPSSGIEALVLLATLQREARFLDLFQEDLESFEDAQIGAAVRDVQRDTKKTLQRLFAIQPLLEQEEGSTVDLSQNYPAHEIRLTGNVGETQPASGTLAHHGWKATKCELPKFQGNLQIAKVVAPAEIEVT